MNGCALRNLGFVLKKENVSCKRSVDGYPVNNKEITMYKKFVVVTRFPRGMGFGNKLFLWSRAIIFARKNGFQFVEPIWFSLRISFLKKSIYNLPSFFRQIALLGVLKKRKSDLAWWQYPVFYIFLKHIKEQDSIEEPCFEKNGICIFRKPIMNFTQFSEERTYLKSCIYEIARPKWIKLIEKHITFSNNAIGVNIRAGLDFPDAIHVTDWETKGPLRTPVLWFANLIKCIRTKIGYQVPVLLISDGNHNYLNEIIILENVVFVQPGCAVSDLLLLSGCKILLGSGGSSFSAWASFLGSIPTITHYGSHLKWYGLNSTPNHYVSTTNRDGSVPEEFLEIAARLFKEPVRGSLKL